MEYIPYIIVGIISAAVFFTSGYFYRKKVAEAEIGSAEEQARKTTRKRKRFSKRRKRSFRPKTSLNRN